MKQEKSLSCLWPVAIVGVALGLMILEGCVYEPHSQPLSVEYLSTRRPDPRSKEVSLLTRTKWDTDLIRALAKQGFSVKKYASTTEVIEEASVARTDRADAASAAYSRTEVYRKAQTRYSLSIYPGPIVNWCINYPGVQFERFVLEVTDLETGEIILVVEKGGWTQRCGKQERILFPELAEALAEAWDSP